MSLTKRALWVIERHLDRELSLADLAAACDVSPCHLSHAFAERVGRPITTYIRARRLSCAAEALAAGAPDILDLALASGYNSHEAFSRAFKELFGVTPETVRRRRTTQALPLLAAIDMTTGGTRTLPAPEIEMTTAMTFVGLFERCTLDGMQGIPALWRRFMACRAEIPDQIDPVPVGVVGSVDADGVFDYGCAVRVVPSSTPPKGLALTTLSAQRYALFRHAEHVSAIRGTYDRIWNQALPDSGWTMADRPTLERHDPTFNPLTGAGGITIWIPVEPPLRERK